MTDQSQALTTRAEAPPPRLRDSAVMWDRNAGRLVPQTLGEVVQFAEAMSKGGIALRKHLRGEMGACLAVCIQAAEWDMSPFALANKSYAVNDQLAYEASVFAAVIINRAPIKGRPKYRFEGEGDERVCICSVMASDGDGGFEPLEHRSPKFGKITPKNSPLWKIDPDQQQSYYTVRAMSRLHFPDVTMGALDVDEAHGMRDDSPPATSGLAARLTGGQTEGFDPSNVVRGIGGAEVAAETAETVDAQGPEGGAEIAEIEVEEVVDDASPPESAPPAESAEETPASDSSPSPSDESTPPSNTAGPGGGASDASPSEEDEDDEWKVLENTEGPAPTGVVYLLASDEIGPDNRLPTYQDGQPWSKVGPKGAALLPQYTDHPAPPEVEEAAPEAEATDAPAEVAEAATEAPSEPEGGFLAEMRKADSWLQIKTQNAALARTQIWAEADEEMRDEMRRAIWGVVVDLKKRTRDPVDQIDDATAFRLWLSTVTDPDAIEGTLEILRASPAWLRLKPEQQAGLTAAAKKAAG